MGGDSLTRKGPEWFSPLGMTLVVGAGEGKGFVGGVGRWGENQPLYKGGKGGSLGRGTGWQGDSFLRAWVEETLKDPHSRSESELRTERARRRAKRTFLLH